LLRRPLLPLAGLFVAVPAAHAADPSMPLSEVRQGMKSVGLSVIRGTTISWIEARFRHRRPQL
jgi:hypothetical protein